MKALLFIEVIDLVKKYYLEQLEAGKMSETGMQIAVFSEIVQLRAFYAQPFTEFRPATTKEKPKPEHFVDYLELKAVQRYQNALKEWEKAESKVLFQPALASHRTSTAINFITPDILKKWPKHLTMTLDDFIREANKQKLGLYWTTKIQSQYFNYY